jgi:hypothetical protein
MLAGSVEPAVPSYLGLKIRNQLFTILVKYPRKRPVGKEWVEGGRVLIPSSLAIVSGTLQRFDRSGRPAFAEHLRTLPQIPAPVRAHYIFILGKARNS